MKFLNFFITINRMSYGNPNTSI